MKLFISALVLITLVGCSEALPEAPQEFPTYHVRIDNSDSNLATSDETFARIVARRVANDIANLPLGTFVSVRSFGEINGENNLRYDVQITRKSNPAANVAREVAREILAQATSDAPRQTSTEIISTLTWDKYNCEAGDKIVLLSDGIPSGRIASQQAVLNGRENLPEPQAGLLQGCKVVFYGFGRTAEGSLTSQQIENLKEKWMNWTDRAGASFETMINP